MWRQNTEDANKKRQLIYIFRSKIKSKKHHDSTQYVHKFSTLNRTFMCIPFDCECVHMCERNQLYKCTIAKLFSSLGFLLLFDVLLYHKKSLQVENDEDEKAWIVHRAFSGCVWLSAFSFTADHKHVNFADTTNRFRRHKYRHQRQDCCWCAYFHSATHSKLTKKKNI